MSKGITVKILGDFGPFSSMGKSIGYEIEVGGSRYLIDCGAPLFQQVGGHGLKGIKGLLITHCHDDHKRWFTDLALFNRYAPDFGRKVPLITFEDLHEELVRSSSAALDRSLSLDARFIVDISYKDYITSVYIGPRAKYRIVSKQTVPGKSELCILDSTGQDVPPSQAKIVISEKSGRPRMLFCDPPSGEWVEPESFYPFSSEVFYEKDQNIFHDDQEGFSIEAIKSPVWHGLTTIGFKVRTENELLVFSSDTNHDEALWNNLYREKRERKGPLSDDKFNTSSIIIGDINDYIERTWSKERYEDALASFNEGVIIHDISFKKSVVHTEYDMLQRSSLRKDRVLLTHSPDKMTSEWVLCDSGKAFKVIKGEFFEVVGDRLLPMNADVYHKEGGRYFVGYKNEKGKYTVHESSNGYLVIDYDELHGEHTPRYRVDLYEDIGGKYYPVLEDGNSIYFQRSDGNIEMIQFGISGSKGTIVSDLRGTLSGRK